ncbi:hypothetical protein ACFOWX_11730 [Sphingorhabdus arenilitoris]|uniref:Uncharacterized protein n=1 Tax=Sphingorhabdus arenilitoris TaxID=1490041 RepID=A0ABV8RIL5_9SPHN
MNAASNRQMQTGMILRVLTGRQRDARYRLSPGLKITIGRSFSHDIVLRGGRGGDFSLILHSGKDISVIEMVSGSITLLGQQLNEGAKAQLPSFVPFEAGGIFIAIGDAESNRWDEALRLTEQNWPADEVPDDDAVPAAGDAAEEQPMAAAAHNAPAKSVAGQLLTKIPVEGATFQHMLTHFSARYRVIEEQWQLDRRWPFLAAAAALLLIGLVMYNPARDWIGQTFNDPAAVEARLERVGFPDLSVERTADGRLMITGLLRTDAEYNRFRDYAREKYPDAEIAVQSMDGLADSATAILEAQAIDAQARPGNGRSLVIDSEYLPGDRQAELKSAILADLPLIKSVTFVMTGQRGDDNLQYFFSKSGFGYASYVEGDPSYIRTADGTTWMKGAKLPTGHTVLDISSGRIRFERMGVTEELVVIEGADPAMDDGTKTDIESTAAPGGGNDSEVVANQ